MILDPEPIACVQQIFEDLIYITGHTRISQNGAKMISQNFRASRELGNGTKQALHAVDEAESYRGAQ